MDPPLLANLTTVRWGDGADITSERFVKDVAEKFVDKGRHVVVKVGLLEVLGIESAMMRASTRIYSFTVTSNLLETSLLTFLKSSRILEQRPALLPPGHNYGSGFCNIVSEYPPGMNLQPPAQGSSQDLKQQRRMTSPVGSLNLALPDGGRRPSPRPPSPLRNGFIMDSSTGIDPDDESDDDEDEDDDPAKWQRSPSPASSVSHLAASFVQRMNNFVGGIGPKSPGMPSDAELEAEAERERDRSRREAEAILTREAHQRKLVEERVLAMMETAKSLPPPPSRSQTLPNPNPPSPAGSQKEANWWTAAKHRLTPTKDKEPLTPAQQVILDAKAREKEKKKESKGKEKEKEKEKEWPSNAQRKFSDPAFANLNIPIPPPTRKPVPASPSSPTPSRPSLSNMPPNLTPSPMRATDSLASSPSREAPPLYAQFNAQGTLDVPGTLLTIAKRFEKLEKWTVGHVRALEERMNDVERWLVDKEKEKEETASMKEASKQPEVEHELQDIREEVAELQGRVGELGREMAKMATAPSRLSNGPHSQTAAVSSAHQAAASMLVEEHTGSSMTSTPHHRRLSSTALESTSPPIASNKTPSGTRLPYPQGDYTSPPDAFSPPNSPPGSVNKRSQSGSISGLPSAAPLSSSSTSYSSGSYSSTSSYGRAVSPTPMSTYTTTRTDSPTPSGNGLPPPKHVAQRQSSVSPTPRKRYTVALGGPIVAPEELSSNAAAVEPPKRTGTPKLFAKPRTSIDNFFDPKPAANDSDDQDEEEEANGFGDETIGKSAAAKLASSGLFSGGPGMGDYKSTPTATTSSSSPSSLSNRRIRAQSAYGFSSIPGASGTTALAAISSPTPPSVAPLRTKARSKSTERLNAGNGNGTGDGMISALAGPGQNKFVDPLILRRQSKEALMKPIAMPKPIGKVPIGQLVAFFDKDSSKKAIYVETLAS
ncbi:hypothetical protein GALMADRAFT_210130 [Galerina marginata CBS 339.88]|uniref:Uncharacterized protein n=1 Tax=Galerina marginata (strain CBS 339.88) TaxID=685588 RepID=A0A067T1H1_GALM3|nr:hypothetical protein GALMADRAFT_210130 [Galerina marginata CBS 339.88]